MLRSIGDKSVVGDLLALLRDTQLDKDIRGAVAWTLGKMGEKQVLYDLLRLTSSYLNSDEIAILINIIQTERDICICAFFSKKEVGVQMVFIVCSGRSAAVRNTLFTSSTGNFSKLYVCVDGRYIYDFSSHRIIVTNGSLLR